METKTNPTTTALDVTVIGPNLMTKDAERGEMHVHAAGCRDIARTEKRNQLGKSYSHDLIGAASKEQVADWIYCDHIDEGSMTLDDAMDQLYFAPCVKLPLVDAYIDLDLDDLIAAVTTGPVEFAGAGLTGSLGKPQPIAGPEIVAPVTETEAAFEIERELAEPAPADEVELPGVEPGTPAAAIAELARRAHNKTVKRTGEGTRAEPLSEWAFKAPAADLKILAAL